MEWCDGCMQHCQYGYFVNLSPFHDHISKYIKDESIDLVVLKMMSLNEDETDEKYILIFCFELNKSFSLISLMTIINMNERQYFFFCHISSFHVSTCHFRFLLKFI